MPQTKFASALSPLLEAAASALDISDELHDDAVLKYEDVGEWLSDEAGPLAKYKPQVYPQGSFRLGTVVRPITDDDHYDIDLVCQLDIAKENTTQEKLKALIGDRLKERRDLEKILDESRRCWNLDYADNFHMDVLPSLNNPERKPYGILLTDTDLVRWQKSNPIAYAEWFKARMTVAFTTRREILAKSLKADVQEVPEWQVKTPLQRVVQLLKRHRDLHFASKPEVRPISIIITTLAARAYGNQMDMAESLEVVLKGMNSSIQYRDGRYVVANPVEPDENFADKWNEKPELRLAFNAWLQKAQADFGNALINRNPEDSARSLSTVLGEKAMRIAASAVGVNIGGPTGALVLRKSMVPALASTAHMAKSSWPENIFGKVWVHGGIYLSSKRGKKLWDLSDRPLAKNVAIKFTAKTNVREPYEVKWQVVNTGQEAAQERGLRGEFYSGDTKMSRWESTRYAGTHWVEALIIKDGECVAKSGRKLVKIRS